MILLNKIKEWALEILFPSQCLGCGQKNIIWCAKCISKLSENERPCAEWIYPLFDYRDPMIKKSIWFLKYQGKKNVASVIGLLMQRRILEDLSELEMLENFREPIVIPIPLSKARLRERKFNQSLLIAEIIAREEKNMTLDNTVLLRAKDVAHQARLKNRAERRENMKNVFKINNPEKIKDRNVILIDDVVTTGATLSEARKTLKKAGAKKIIAFTFAH